MQLKKRCAPFNSLIREGRKQGLYPYFRPISYASGAEVEIDGQRKLMLASNDYLGLAQDPRVQEAASKALRKWGTATGGSRFLCGNLTLHEVLEERLAAFVGKKRAILFVTGFSANLGALESLITPEDIILCDRENHASLFQGARTSGARMMPFDHNDALAAGNILTRIRKRRPCSDPFLITEGIFSMSGDISNFPDLIQLKTTHPDLLIYLDDAHGIGVLGKQGRGTANHFGLTDQTDFIMGTFSKALASIGGFIASDHEDIMEYLRHHATPLIFSAALPAVNAATVLACLDILEREPEQITCLHKNADRIRDIFRHLDLPVRNLPTPIIPIYVGPEEKAYQLSHDMFNMGIFALPAVFPAVPRKKAIIRTACTTLLQEEHYQKIETVLAVLSRKYQIRQRDFEIERQFVETGKC